MIVRVLAFYSAFYNPPLDANYFQMVTMVPLRKRYKLVLFSKSYIYLSSHNYTYKTVIILYCILILESKK